MKLLAFFIFFWPALATLKDAPAMNVELKIEAKLAKGKPQVTAFLKIINESDKPEKFERYRAGIDMDFQWPTNNFFVVRLGQNEVRYIGMMMKRGTPEEADFITLKPGGTASGNFDLSEAYGWKDKSAEYTIWYNSIAKSQPVKFKFKN